MIATLKGGKQPSGMAINRAGNLALVANRADNSVTVLSIRGKEVKVVDTVAMGEQVSADGNIDTVAVIDLEATPPRVIDQVVVGDGPEGFAISPTGEIAVAILLRGSNANKSAFFYNRNGSVAVLKIDGKYLYVGNYMDDDISILKVDGTASTACPKLTSVRQRTDHDARAR